LILLWPLLSADIHESSPGGSDELDTTLSLTSDVSRPLPWLGVIYRNWVNYERSRHDMFLDPLLWPSIGRSRSLEANAPVLVCPASISKGAAQVADVHGSKQPVLLKTSVDLLLQVSPLDFSN